MSKMQYREYPERPYPPQDPYQPRGHHEQEPYSPYEADARHFNYDNYDDGYDPRYGAGDLAHYDQYSPRSPTRPEAYTNQDPYPSQHQYNVEPELKGYHQFPQAGRHDLDRFASPGRDVGDYKQQNYIPEPRSPKMSRHPAHHEHSRYPGPSEQNRYFDDFDRGYSSADEYMHRPHGRYERSKHQHSPRKHANEQAKYEIPPPDYTMNRYDDRYNMSELARALPPAHKSGRAAGHKRETNNYGRSADDRGIKYHKSSSGYPKYGSPDFDYKKFQKRTSEMKQLNQKALDLARYQPRPQPQERYDRSRPANDDRYHSRYARY